MPGHWRTLVVARRRRWPLGKLSAGEYSAPPLIIAWRCCCAILFGQLASTGRICWWLILRLSIGSSSCPTRSCTVYGAWPTWCKAPFRATFGVWQPQLRQGPLPGKVVSVLYVFSGCQMLFPAAGLFILWQTAGQHYSITDKFNHDGPLSVLTGLAANQPHARPHSIGHRAT